MNFLSGMEKSKRSASVYDGGSSICEKLQIYFLKKAIFLIYLKHLTTKYDMRDLLCCNGI